MIDANALDIGDINSQCHAGRRGKYIHNPRSPQIGFHRKDGEGKGKPKLHVPPPRSWIHSYAPDYGQALGQRDVRKLMHVPAYSVPGITSYSERSALKAIEGLVEIPYAFKLSYSTNRGWRALIGKTVFSNYGRFKLTLLWEQVI